MRVWHRLIDRGTASTDKPGQGPESGMGPYRSRSRLRVMRPFVVNGTKIMGEKTQTGLLMPQPKKAEEEVATKKEGRGRRRTSTSITISINWQQNLQFFFLRRFAIFFGLHMQKEKSEGGAECEVRWGGREQRGGLGRGT